MNFYVDSGGVVLRVEPERIFQGSANANTIRFIGAFASNLPVLVAFKLPNGVWTMPQSMGFSAQLSGVETKDGVQFNTWEYQIPQTITENYGTVNVQFYVYGDAGGTGGQIASAMSSFVVEKGVPITLPDPTDDYQTLLTQILAVLSQLQGEIGDLPNNYVTVDTNQTIEGNKTHTGINTFNGFTSINGIGIDADAIVKGSDRFKYPVKSGTLALTSDIPENIVTKDENGQIKVPLAPAQDDDAVSKKYVDDADNTKLNKVEPFANGTYAYIVSKDDQFGTTNGYTEISETDKISTIAKRKTNGCIETRTPYADVEAANKGYVDTAISDTQGQLAQTNQNVEDLYTILEQAQVVTVTTLEQAYTARETADGENIVDGVQTTVKEIRGKTVKTTNLYPYEEYPAQISEITYEKSFFVEGGKDYYFRLFGVVVESPGCRFGFRFFDNEGNNISSRVTIANSDFYYNPSMDAIQLGEDKTSFNYKIIPSESCYVSFGITQTEEKVTVRGNLMVSETMSETYSPYFPGLKNAFFKEIVSTGKNLFSGANVTTGNCTYENGVAKQIAADTSSNYVWKVQLYKDTTFVSQVDVEFSNTGRTPALTFEKTSAVNRLVFGLNGATMDTLLSIYISEFPNGTYTITWNVLNTTQGSISWNDIMLNYGSVALPYEPYTSDTLSVENPIELAEYDVAYPETGEIQRQSNTVTFNGTESWYLTAQSEGYFLMALNINPHANKVVGDIISNRGGNFAPAGAPNSDFGFYIANADFSALVIWFNKNFYPNVTDLSSAKSQLAAWAEAGDPLTITYKTAEATTEATPFNKSKYIAWKNGSETIEQGDADNSGYGAEDTVKQDYFTLTGGTTNV